MKKLLPVFLALLAGVLFTASVPAQILRFGRIPRITRVPRPIKTPRPKVRDFASIQRGRRPAVSRAASQRATGAKLQTRLDAFKNYKRSKGLAPGQKVGGDRFRSFRRAHTGDAKGRTLYARRSGFVKSSRQPTGYTKSSRARKAGFERRAGKLDDHHIVPHELRRHPAVQRANYPMNKRNNLVHLPSASKRPGGLLRRTQHRWSKGHKAYNKHINRELDKIHRKGKSRGWGSGRYLKEVQQLSNRHRSKLKKGVWKF